MSLLHVISSDCLAGWEGGGRCKVGEGGLGVGGCWGLVFMGKEYDGRVRENWLGEGKGRDGEDRGWVG